MALQIINTGTSANAGNGDSIRTAFTKVNQNFDYLNGIVLGTSTNFNSGVRDVVKPMFVHDSHVGIAALYNPINDRVVLSLSSSSVVTFDSLTVKSTSTFDTVRVINTATMADVVITGTVTMGFLQGFDDVNIIKFASDGSLNFRMRNMYGLGSSEINLWDQIEGQFNIIHQNSGANNGLLRAGQNYIYDDTGRAINIGRNSNINFYSNSGWSEYVNPEFSITNTGTVNVRSTLTIAKNFFVIDGKVVSITGTTISIDGIAVTGGAGSDKLLAGTYTLTLTTTGNVVLPGDVIITANETSATVHVNSSSLILNNNGHLVLNQNNAYNGSVVPGTLFRVDTDQPNYTQLTLHNLNSGNTATSDVIIVRDNGDVETASGVLDIGINSSNYVEEEPFGIHTPGSAYMFTNDADLIIGTQTPGSRLVFHAGGTTTNDSAGSLDGFAWRFNRDVQVVVPTAGPLNFTVWNTRNNSAAQAIYQAMNDAGQYLKMGLNSTNAGAYYGAIGPKEGFVHIDGSTATLHVGGTGDLMFWSDEPNGGYETGQTATLYMSRVDRTSTFGGHVLPASDLTYDLGSSSKQWRSLWVGTSTIYIGGVPISVNTASNTLVVGTPTTGTTTATNLATESFVIDYVAQNGGGGATNTGDITFNGVKIIGAGTASGDGLGYSTLELVPDGTLNTDQYIVVDPTTPNHIHLRAGGTQDASTAALFLGGELNYVRAIDGNGVRLNNAQFIPDTAYFAVTTDYDSATWSTDESGNHWIDIVISDPFNPTRDATPINTAGSRFAQYPTRNSIEVFTGSSLYTVSGNGQAYTLGNPYNYRIGTVEAPPANPTTLASLDYRLNTFNERYLYLENNTLEAYADTVSVFSGQTIDLVTGVGNIRIATDDNNSSYSWYFTAQGYLQFPQGLAPTTSKGKAGDEAGSVVVDADYIYYCHTDYTDGIADIWKRVQWSNDTW